MFFNFKRKTHIYKNLVTRSTNIFHEYRLGSDHHQSVWNEMKKQRRTKPRRRRFKKAPEKLCSSAPRTNPALNTSLCWFHVVNRSRKSIYDSIFTQVSKAFWAFLKRLLLGLVRLCFFISFQTDWWWSDLKHLTGLLQLMAKLIFPTDTLQQKIQLKPFLAAGDTSVIITLASAVNRTLQKF